MTRRAVALADRLPVRTRMLALLCVMYFLTYIDRVNISTAGPAIRADLGLSNTSFGLALSAFALPYAFFQAVGGLLAVRFGPRVVLGAAGVVWAVSTAATGFALGLVSLFAARLALGFGEGAAFPTATQAMIAWVKPQARGWAQGITHAFSRLGNAITPLAMAALIATLHWRAAFWILGALSLAWAGLWWWRYRDQPADHARMTDDQLDELPRSSQAREQPPPTPWRRLLPAVAPLTFVDFCYGWMLWVYLTWLPSFFAGDYGLDLTHFALYASLVLLTGVAGDIVGGLVSDRLLAHGDTTRTGRRHMLVVGLGASFAFVLPTLFIHQLAVVTACLGAAFFFLETCNPVLWAAAMDIAPAHAGTAAGLMNTGFGLAGVLAPFAFGLLVDRSGSWTVPFGLSASLLLLGCLTAQRLRRHTINPAGTAARQS